MPKELAIALRVKVGMIFKKDGAWTCHVRDTANTHKEAKALITNKVNALNERRPLDEGGDPSAIEWWQHGVGMIAQNGTQIHEPLRIGGFRTGHMN